jgi:hypothetical protein
MTKFNGLIQHSFALRMDRERRPFRKGDNLDRIAERFTPADGRIDGFEVELAQRLATSEELSQVAFHSPLTQHDRTHVRPLKQHFLDGEKLPAALAWADRPENHDPVYAEEPRFIFARAEEGERCRLSFNDFVVHRPGGDSAGERVSRALLEVLAHRRSRLFGLSLADRIVNVMLPHATLASAGSAVWLLHPLVTLVCDGRDHADFSNTYSLTCFLVPVDGEACAERRMSKREIEEMVNAGWCLATSPPCEDIPRFEAKGHLLDYLSKLSGCELTQLAAGPVGLENGLTLRQLTELAAFGLAVSTAQGSTGRANAETMRRIGDDVVTSLGSARVSSVLVVDRRLSRGHVRKPIESSAPPGAFLPLMKTLSRENRAPDKPWSAKERRRYRLDRPFADDDGYVAGILPRNRCLVVASVAKGQHGTRESGLMQAGSAAYMTIGAASAIGTMRAIDRELEQMEGEDPRKIADIDGEIAADLHDLYDLDITREAFRNIYRLMRKRLGINSDFETLQSKMEALYRATSTNEAVRSQRLLMWLTVVLAVLTVLLILKPGG